MTPHGCLFQHRQIIPPGKDRWLATPFSLALSWPLTNRHRTWEWSCAIYLKRTPYFTDRCFLFFSLEASDSVSLQPHQYFRACLPWNKEATGLKVPSGQWNGTLMVEDIQSRLPRLGIWNPKTYHPNTEPQEVWLDVYKGKVSELTVCDSHRMGICPC